jgi:hypothetical protein
MIFSKSIAIALLKQCRELTMTPETVCVYLFMFSNDGKSISTKEVAVTTGLNIKTTRRHIRLLEEHEVIELGEPTGREKRRKVTVKPVLNQTIPSSKLSSLYTIINIPSQKSFAQLARVESSNTIEEEGSTNVWSGSGAEDLYVHGKYGLAKAARQAVHRAISNGEIEQPNKCESCGLPCATIPFHHAGYDHTNWFDVRWLCRSCYAKEAPSKLKRSTFTVKDIREDEDWKKAYEVLKKYFKDFEVDPKSLTKKRRFSALVGLLEDEGFDFNGYAHWYEQFKYDDRGFNFGLFLYPGMISEYRSYAEQSGKYLNVSSRLKNSETFKSDVEKTKEFLGSLEDNE